MVYAIDSMVHRDVSLGYDGTPTFHIPPYGVPDQKNFFLIGAQASSENYYYVSFLIRENVIFFPKIPVFSLLVQGSGPKIKNSDPQTKVTYTMLKSS